jgi:hypothetical protein
VSSAKHPGAAAGAHATAASRFTQDGGLILEFLRAICIYLLTIFEHWLNKLLNY